MRASSTGAVRDIPEARPDCVITDLMMPVMDGFELTRQLRNRPELAAMKIVILSAKSYDFDRRRAKEMGADGYLTKPINRETFLKSINEMVSDIDAKLDETRKELARLGSSVICEAPAEGSELVL